MCECASTELSITHLLFKASSISEVIRIFKHLNIYLLRLGLISLHLVHQLSNCLLTFALQPHVINSNHETFWTSKQDFLISDTIHSACQKSYLCFNAQWERELESFFQTNTSHVMEKYVWNKVLLPTKPIIVGPDLAGAPHLVIICSL